MCLKSAKQLLLSCYWDDFWAAKGGVDIDCICLWSWNICCLRCVIVLEFDVLGYWMCFDLIDLKCVRLNYRSLRSLDGCARARCPRPVLAWSSLDPYRGIADPEGVFPARLIAGDHRRWSAGAYTRERRFGWPMGLNRLPLGPVTMGATNVWPK